MQYVKLDLNQYAQLRTILDSVQSGALSNYLNAPSQEARDECFWCLSKNLKPIHDHLRAIAPGGNCPPGEWDCGGYCSAYPCTATF